MRRAFFVACLAATASLPVMAADSTVMRAAQEPVDGLILKLRPAVAEGALQTTAQAGRRMGRLADLARQAGYPGSVAWRHLSDRMVSVKLPSELTPAQQSAVMARLMASGQVEWVQANERMWPHAVATPNDPAYTNASAQNQWWANATPSSAANAGVPNIVGAWSITTGRADGQSTPMAILDTGRLAHEDLRSRNTEPASALPGYDFVNDVSYSNDSNGRDSDETDPGDYGCSGQSSSWHGLAIEGIVSAKANNGVGMAGIHWAPRVMSVRVAGRCGAAMDDIVSAMYWSAGITPPSSVSSVSTPPAVAARVINISFGGTFSCDNAYQTAVNDLKSRREVVVVASAGNEHGAVSRPANCANVVSVAALNRLGLKSTYSNFGAQVTVSTVGGDPAASETYTDAGAWSSALGDTGLYTVGNRGTTSASGVQNDYFLYAGTSFSAPIVTGVIALMLDVNPNLSVDDVIAGLRASARPHVSTALVAACSNSNPGRCRCTTSTCGAGILDAKEAVRWAQLKLTNAPYSNPNVAMNLDADPTVSAKLEYALSVAGQDRPANVSTASTSSGSSGGGGGSLDLLGGAMLAAMAAARAWRGRRVISRCSR